MNPLAPAPSRLSRLLPAIALVAGLSATLPPPARAQAGTAAPRADAAWARPTVQGQAAGGAYLRITGGDAPDRLVGASAAAVAKTVELHTMQMDGNVMRMREVAAIDVAPGKPVELAPGGLHLMLTGLQRPLENGSSFPLTLRFEKAGAVTVDVKVTATPPAGAAASPAHDHKH